MSVEAVIHSMRPSLFHRLFWRERYIRTCTHTCVQVSGHRLHRDLTSCLKCDRRKGELGEPSPCSSSSFNSFCWVKPNHYLASSWRWERALSHAITPPPAPKNAQTHTNRSQYSPLAYERLQQYQHHLISVSSGALYLGQSRVCNL